MRLQCTCVVCGTTRTIKPHLLAEGRGKYCSRACYYVSRLRHGGAVRGHKSPEYMAWTGIKQRTTNPASLSYSDYGGRGITMCPAWDSFDRFYADMGARPSPKHSIDRIDNDGPYNPENCRWATRGEQQTNRRVNIRMTYQGRTLTLSEWARESGIHHNTINSRFKRGLPPEDVLKPLRAP